MKKNILKLKKYLFLISIIFLVTTLSHLIYTFLYNDSKFIAISGGSISEGLIGDFPSLNPLKQLSGNNKYMINLLYRSLLKWDSKENKIVGDIATCDISNLTYIECYLEDNIKWSNGELLTSEDILNTYKILQNTDINPIISSLLSNTEINAKENIISFKNEKSDVNFLNVLFQPIVNSNVINDLGEDNLNGNFSTINGIYSGKYKISNVSNDLSIGIVKFIFEKNEYYSNNPILIDKFIIKLFSNTNSFLKNKNSINIFNDKDNIIGDSMPRFDVKQYTLPQYVGVFINKENIDDTDLRTFILNQINRNNLIKILGESNYKAINNPYLTEEKLQSEAENKNIEELISKLGYYKKSSLIKLVMEKANSKTYSSEAEIEKDINTSELNIDDYQKESEYIVSPDYIDKYNFLTKDNFLLSGVTPQNTQEVYINDYKLTGFKANDRYFYYRIKEGFNNIQEGNNIYKIYFTIDGENKLYEEINIIYYKNKEKLEEEKLSFLKNLEIEKIKETQTEELEQKNDEKKQKTIEALLERLNELDELSYYNQNLEKFNLDLVYIDGDKEINQTALFIENSLKEIGIEVESTPITLSGLQDYISGEKNYDMILSGINTGYFPFNLFAYLHSSQVKNGFNFSKIRKTSLDILLEDLQDSILGEEEIKEKEEQILSILKKEQILKTLYTPNINLLVDKNINNIEFYDYIPDNSLRIDIFDNANINEKRIINFENKNTINFFKFIINKLND